MSVTKLNYTIPYDTILTAVCVASCCVVKSCSCGTYPTVLALQMFNDIGTKDNRFGMLVTDPTTKRPCKYGAVMEVRCTLTTLRRPLTPQDHGLSY